MTSSGGGGGINLTTLWVNVAPSLAGMQQQMSSGGKSAASAFMNTFAPGVMSALGPVMQGFDDLQKKVDPLMKGLESGFDQVFKGVNVGLHDSIEAISYAMDHILEGKAPDLSDFTASFQEVEGMIGEVGQSMVGWVPIIGDLAAKFVGAWTDSIQQVTGLFGEFAGALQEIGNQWQEVGRQIEGATGASEENLDRYLDVTQQILSSGDIVHLKDVATAIGVIGDRVQGINNEQLREFTTLVAQSEELLGKTDVGQAVGALNAWGVAADEMAEKYAGLVGVAQSSKTPIDTITNQLQQLGPVMQDFGLTLDGTGDLLGKFTEGGYKMDRFAQIFTHAARVLGKDGEDIKGQLSSVFEYADNLLKNESTHAAGTNYLESIFGPYGFERIRAMLEDPKIGLQGLEEAMKSTFKTTAEGVAEQVDKTANLGDMVEVVKNRLVASWREIGTELSTSLTGAGENLNAWFEEHHAEIMEFTEGVFNGMVTIVSTITNLTGDALKVVSPFLNVIKEGVYQVSDAIITAFQAVTSMGKLLPGTLGDAFGDADTALNKLSGLNGMLENIDISKYVTEAGNALKDFSGTATEFGRNADENIFNPIIRSAGAMENLGKHFQAVGDGGFKLTGSDIPAMEEGLKKIGLVFDKNQDNVVTKVTAANEKMKDEFETWYKEVTGKDIKVDVVVNPTTPDGTPIGAEGGLAAFLGTSLNGSMDAFPSSPAASGAGMSGGSAIPTYTGSSGSSAVPSSYTGATLMPRTASPGDPALVAELKKRGVDDKLIRLIQGFSAKEGSNPSGNPTLGWMDNQPEAGGTSLEGHVTALLNQFQNRAGQQRPGGGGLIGTFPENGTDEEQATWIANVVGQNNSPSGPDGMPQGSRAAYIAQIVSNMSGVPTAPSTTATATPTIAPFVPAQAAPPVVQATSGGLPTLSQVTPPLTPVAGAAAPSVIPAPIPEDWKEKDGWHYVKDTAGLVWWVPPGITPPPVANGSIGAADGFDWRDEKSTQGGTVKVLQNSKFMSTVGHIPDTPVDAPPPKPPGPELKGWWKPSTPAPKPPPPPPPPPRTPLSMLQQLTANEHTDPNNHVIDGSIGGPSIASQFGWLGINDPKPDVTQHLGNPSGPALTPYTQNLINRVVDPIKKGFDWLSNLGSTDTSPSAGLPSLFGSGGAGGGAGTGGMTAAQQEALRKAMGYAGGGVLRFDGGGVASASNNDLANKIRSAHQHGNRLDPALTNPSTWAFNTTDKPPPITGFGPWDMALRGMGFAGGGMPRMISGPGTGTSDDILGLIDGHQPIKVSNGESINTAVSTEQNLPWIKAMNSGLKLPAFSGGGVAGDNSDTSDPTHGGSIPGVPSGAGEDIVDFMKQVVQQFNTSYGTQLQITGDRAGGNEQPGDVGHGDDGGQHSVNRAIDIGGPAQQRAQFIQWWESDPGRTQLTRQLIASGLGADPNSYEILGGQQGSYHGEQMSQIYSADNPQHGDHIHLALQAIPGAGADGSGNMALSFGQVNSPQFGTGAQPQSGGIPQGATQNANGSGYVTDPYSGRKVYKDPHDFAQYVYDQGQRNQQISGLQGDIQTAGTGVDTANTEYTKAATAHDAAAKAMADKEAEIRQAQGGNWQPGDPIAGGQPVADAWQKIVDKFNETGTKLDAAGEKIKSATKGMTDKQEQLNNLLTKPPPEEKSSKGSTTKGDKNAETFGKGLLGGIMQSLGLDGSLFDDPMNWGITKLGAGAANYGMGMLKAMKDQGSPLLGDQGGDAGGPSAPGGAMGLGFLKGLAPNASSLLQPNADMPNQMGSADDQQSGVISQQSGDVNFNLSGIMDPKNIGPIASNYIATGTRGGNIMTSPTVPTG